MNKELIEKQDLLTKVKMTMLYASKTGMYEKEAQEIIELCADEAIDAVDEYAKSFDAGIHLIGVVNAIERRMK